MRSRFVGRMAAGAAVVALLAACSGDEGGPGAEKVRYIEQSDAVCRETFPKTSGLTARDQGTAERASQEWDAAAQKLKGIPQPQESIELARQFVTQVENISLSYLAAARNLGVNDQAGATKAFDDAETLKRDASEVAEDYGFKDCRAIATA